MCVQTGGWAPGPTIPLGCPAAARSARGRRRRWSSPWGSCTRSASRERRFAAQVPAIGRVEQGKTGTPTECFRDRPRGSSRALRPAEPIAHAAVFEEADRFVHAALGPDRLGGEPRQWVALREGHWRVERPERVDLWANVED